MFARHPDVRLGLLFGSVARGTAGAQSDVDIAVSGPCVDLPLLASQLSLAIGREVDVVAIDRDPPIALLRALLDDATCIYEAAPGAEASFRDRASWAVETDGPLIDRMARAYIARLAAGAAR